MSYSMFDKTLTIRISDYSNMVFRIYKQYTDAIEEAVLLDNELEQRISHIDLSFPNITWYIGGAVDSFKREIYTSMDIYSETDEEITLEYDAEGNSIPTTKSLVLLSAIERYLPIISEKMISKDILSAKTNWTYSPQVYIDKTYDDLATSDIPSFRQAKEAFYPILNANIPNALFSYTSTDGNMVATKRYCLDYGNQKTTDLIECNPSIVSGDSFRLEGKNIELKESVALVADQITIDDTIIMSPNSILVRSYTDEKFSSSNIENVDVLNIVRPESYVLSQNDAITEDDIPTVIKDKLSINTQILPYNTKVWSVEPSSVASDIEIMSLLKLKMEELYSSLIIKGDSSDIDTIEKLIDDKIAELRFEFFREEECGSFEPIGESSGCHLTDEDFRALKPKRLVEKWLMKQILTRGLIFENEKKFSWI